MQVQIVAVECERDQPVTSCEATEIKRHDLLRLKGLGPTLSSTLTRAIKLSVFWAGAVALGTFVVIWNAGEIMPVFAHTLRAV